MEVPETWRAIFLMGSGTSFTCVDCTTLRSTIKDKVVEYANVRVTNNWVV